MTDENKSQLLTRRQALKIIGGTGVAALVGDKIAAATESPWVKPPQVEAAEITQLPEVVEIETLAGLEDYFRASDPDVLGAGKSVNDFDEIQIREKRNEHGINHGPFRAIYVVGENVWNLIEQQGESIIGTNKPAEYFAAQAAYWQKMCSDAGMSEKDLLVQIVKVNDPLFNSTEMQRLNQTEGNSDAGTWRTHKILDTNGSVVQQVMEPLTADQLTFFPNSFAADNYPLNVTWGSWVTITINGVTKNIRIDVGATHEWDGHTSGKGNVSERLAGAMIDRYWQNYIDIKTKLNNVGINTSARSLLWDPDSIMNLWNFGITPTLLSGCDVAESLYRAHFCPEYGGVHADGLASNTFPSGMKIEPSYYFHAKGYSLNFIDRGGTTITDMVTGDSMGQLTLDGNVQKLKLNMNNGIQLGTSQDNMNVSFTDYFFPLDNNDKPILPIPFPLLNLIALQQADSPEEIADIEIHLNTDSAHINQFDSESGGENGIYIKTFTGLLDSETIRERNDVYGWTTIPIPSTEDGSNFVTVIWTGDPLYQMESRHEVEISLPLVMSNGPNVKPSTAPRSEDVDTQNPLVITSISPEVNVQISQEQRQLMLATEEKRQEYIHNRTRHTR